MYYVLCSTTDPRLLVAGLQEYATTPGLLLCIYVIRGVGVTDHSRLSIY